MAGNKKARNYIDKTLRDLSLRREAPKSGYVLLVLLYIVVSFFTVVASRNGMMTISLFGNQIPFSAFAGALSSLANIFIICLVLLYRKVGFLTALILLLSQFPLLIINIFFRHNVNNFSGLFMNLLTLTAAIVIFLTYSKVLKYQKTLRDQAVKDRMTGLPNRFACSELLEDLIRRGEKFAVVSIDLNDFKSINDTMGHDIGDMVLRKVSDRWSSLAEVLQVEVNVFVARLSGDEFMLIIRGYRTPDDLEKTINNFKYKLEKKMTIDDCDFFLTACYGYTEFPKDSNDINTLFVYADAALHEAKRKRGNFNVLRFTPDILTSEKGLDTERKIRAALENNLVSFNLQPQYDISHKLRGFEALARMKDTSGNMISPAEFIPVAEKTGLIDQIDNRVFELSVKFLADVLRANKDSDLIVSVNVSVRHLMKNNFMYEIKKILNDYQVPASQIEIEITESIMIDSLETAMQRIDAIKALGMKVAIDDFGTGYSSLSYLNNFKSDVLKIDKSFIDKMNTSESSKQYVATIVSIGHILNLSVISEGVEEESQIETLRSIGCDYIQGYIWGRPMPVDDALEIVFS